MKLVKAGNNVSTDAAEAAGYWVMRLDSPGCRPADRAAFEAWRVEKPEHAKAFAQAQRVLANVDRHLGSVELSALGEQVFEESGKQHRSLIRYSTVGLAVACSLLVGVVLYQHTAVGPPVEQPVLADANTIETVVGERSTVTLPDDSIVTLNTNSLIELRFNENSDVRQLELLRGQAHFEVNKDPRPFEVLAGDHRIVALGTAFDVRLDTELGVQVTLVEGEVTVDEVVEKVANIDTVNSTIPETSTTTGTPTRTDLKAGEQLIVRHHEPPTVVKADLEQVVGWREGRLVFRDDPLRDAVKEINRYSTKQLFISDDERLETLRVSGVFRTGSTAAFVTALETFYPLKGERIAYNRTELQWWDKDPITDDMDQR